MDHLATRMPLLDAEAIEAWTEAWDGDLDATVFHHPMWAELSVDPAGASTASLIRADHAVCAVKVTHDGVLRFLTDPHVTDLACPVGDPAEAAAVVDGFDEIEGWTQADLDGLTGRAWLDPMAVAAKVLGYDVEIATVDTTPKIHLAGSFEDYLAAIGSKQRHEVRRKARRLERELGAWQTRVSDAASLTEDIDAFVAQHRLAVGEKAAFMTSEHEALFQRAARTTFQRGWLRLIWLETVSGEQLAAVWSFVVRDRWLVWNSSFDPVHRELSTGMIAMAEAIRLACEEQCGVFDLLRGDEAYKYRLGAMDDPVYSLRLHRTRT